jgi:hypothetical protein
MDSNFGTAATFEFRFAIARQKLTETFSDEKGKARQQQQRLMSNA